MRQIGVAERRARLARRHHLAAEARATGVAELAGDLVGLHATDPATVVVAACARLAQADPAQVEDALYVERSVVRMLGMRRTMFVVPVGLMPVIQAACTSALVPGERRKVVKLLEAGGVTSDPAAWLAATEQEALEALTARGEATTSELGQDVPALRQKVVVGAGTRNEASQSLSSRVVFLLAAEGLIVRTRPLGSWTSTLNRWAPIETWLAQPPTPVSEPAAAVELARRWLRAFGPGTYADLKWWTGWPAGLLKRTLAEVGPVEVGLDDGEVGLVLADDVDVDPIGPPEPWAALLPGLDPTVMGWFERDWFLGAHREQLFDRTGNAGPTIWCDGRVVGGWGQRKDGEIVVRLLDDVGRDGETAIAAAAAALGAWVGPVRLTPRFRTPLERSLTA